MGVLTDSYTIDQTVSGSFIQSRKFCHQEFISPDYVSTTLIWGTPVGINEHIHQLLNELEDLSPNWDGEDAPAIEPHVINESRKLITKANQYRESIYHIAPGPNGEVMLDFRSQKRSLEIIFYSTRSVFVKFPENGRPEQGFFTFTELPGLLEWLHQ